MKKEMSSGLFDYQLQSAMLLDTGSILSGGVGSGKSITSLAYFFIKECGGKLRGFTVENMENPKDLIIITTAKKRDSKEWLLDLAKFSYNVSFRIVVDSWNNIRRYIKEKNSFFIFDEQRLVGSGSWVRSFLKISKSNRWILLTATPGDTWMDYIPVFIANGFYSSRSEFIRRHVVYNSFTKYPKIDRYVETNRLEYFKRRVLVSMSYDKKSKVHHERIVVTYDKTLMDLVEERWNPFKNKPILDISEFCYTARKVINSDVSRLEAIKKLIVLHKKLIIFYNFDYELELLRTLKEEELELAEYNGHKHEELPKGRSWIYLVQYNSGAEGWNCIETNAIVFYSQTYSYKTMVQAAGRIDRLNSPFMNLYIYTITTNSKIDIAIAKSLSEKKDFNEKHFLSTHKKHVLL